MLLVAKLNQMLFGRKSEKVLRQIEQLEFQLEDLQAASAAEEVQTTAPAERSATAKPHRRPLPEHLPREVHTHMPGHDACPDCGGRLRELGEDVAEMLEYVRASFKVLRHVRPKLSCDACDRIVQAPAPSRPIEPRTGRTGAAGACAGVQVCRPSAALPAVGHLRSRRRRPGSLDAGRLGRRNQRAAGSACASCSRPRSQRNQAARRRHAGPGARTRQRQDEDWKALDLRPRRPALG